jgi:autotransporter-associated beta strand protein
MKTTRKSFGAASALLVASILALPPLTAQIAWTGVGTYTQDFSGFNGTEASLPTGFFAEADESPLPFVPGGSGGTVDGTNSTTGFRTFRLTTSPVDPDKRWFGIFEGAALSDSRLFAEIENTSGAPITALRVRYRTSIWRDGNRQNSIRLKYNNSTGGFSSVPDSDVWVPSVNAGGNIAYDGNDSAYSSQRDVIITLPTPLPNNSTGYLRWQYSTNTGSGSRDGLGITDIQIDAISEGIARTWDGGSANWSTTNWDGGSWIAGRKATFIDPSDTVSVNGNFVVNGIQFSANNVTLSNGGGALALAGSVTIGNASHTATINADIVGADLVKNGLGTLVLGGDADLSGDLKLFAGTVRIGSTFSISNTARVDLGNNTTFDLDGNDLTVRGLNGAESGTVDIDGAILTLVQNGSGTSYRGAIIGNGDIIKAGSGEQEFQDAVKVYSGETVVEQGTLAVTLNGIMTHTAAITVNGPETELDPTGYGELLLNRDETYLFGSALGSAPSITLDGGWLATDSGVIATLENPVVLEVPVGVDLDAQGRPDLGNQIYARGATGLLELTGAITGTGGFRKQGQGELILSSSANTYSGGTNVRNGTLTVPAGGSLGSGPLLFTNDEDTRTLILEENATVSLLDGNSPDPAEMGVNNAFLEIASGKTLTVDQAEDVFFDAELEEWVEINTRFQGDILGAGNFVKDGLGYLSFSRYAKTLTGSVSINEGVLDVSAPAALASVSAINVAQGGQLRLATNGTGVSYAFGGPLNLGSTQRATGGDLQDDRGFGILGGLRYDPASGVNSATLSSAIVVTANADIHVNGVDKTLTHSGAFSSSGTYDLARTGGGTFVLTGMASGYNGTLTLLNGATVINTTLGNTTTPVSITVGYTVDAAAPASLSGTGQVNGDVNYVTDSGIVVSATTPVLTINGDLDLGTAEIDTSGVGSGTYNLFDVTGTASFGSVTITGGGSISQVGNTVRVVK